MFLFSRHVCTRCGLELPPGWGAFLYVTAAGGERIACPPSLEEQTIARVANMTFAQALEAGRLGYQTQCICLGCARQFPLDLDRDAMRCPDCPAAQVITAAELIGGVCPRCRSGIIGDRAVETSDASKEKNDTRSSERDRAEALASDVAWTASATFPHPHISIRADPSFKIQAYAPSRPARIEQRSGGWPAGTSPTNSAPPATI